MIVTIPPDRIIFSDNRIIPLFTLFKGNGTKIWPAFCLQLQEILEIGERDLKFR